MTTWVSGLLSKGPFDTSTYGIAFLAFSASLIYKRSSPFTRTRSSRRNAYKGHSSGSNSSTKRMDSISSAIVFAGFITALFCLLQSSLSNLLQSSLSNYQQQREILVAQNQKLLMEQYVKSLEDNNLVLAEAIVKRFSKTLSNALLAGLNAWVSRSVLDDATLTNTGGISQSFSSSS